MVPFVHREKERKGASTRRFWIISYNVSRAAKAPCQSPLGLVSMWTRGGSRRGMQGTSTCSSNRARNQLLSTSPHLCCCHFLATALILVGTVLGWALKMHAVKHLERTKNEDKATQLNAGKSMIDVRWNLYGSMQARSVPKYLVKLAYFTMRSKTSVHGV